MSTPLMSVGGLFAPGTITMKHVVPWKTREEFLTVLEDLYLCDEFSQQQAVDKINMWKSRAGTKLSVAIESSGSLTQALLDYGRAKRHQKLQQSDSQLRSSLSLAVIRFVNHITEKGQTKAVAQPVHIIAKEFDIPEWIVRLRHDATHNHLPSLDTLVVAAKWALSYLKDKFWNQQKKDSEELDSYRVGHSNDPKMSHIRNAIYEFQKERFQDLKDSKEGRKDTDRQTHSDCLKNLHKYLNQNRMKFLKCLLEDGVLIATEEQLDAFGVQPADLLYRLPPSLPSEMSEFWSPLLRKVNSSGCLALLLQTLVFSVSSQEGLRNYQLVAWLCHLLAQAQAVKRRSKGKRKYEGLFKIAPSIPKKLLLTACLQNMNLYTVFLLKYLGDKESIGPDGHSKLSKLLDLHTKVSASHSATSGDSDTDDTVYTVQDVKKARQGGGSGNRLSAGQVTELESTVEKTELPWKLCTDLVDWSTVPFGVIPSQSSHDDLSDEPEMDESDRTKRKKDWSSDDNDDDDDRDDYPSRRRVDDEDESDDKEDDDMLLEDESRESDEDRRSSIKRRKFVASDDLL